MVQIGANVFMPKMRWFLPELCKMVIVEFAVDGVDVHFFGTREMMQVRDNLHFLKLFVCATVSTKFKFTGLSCFGQLIVSTRINHYQMYDRAGD
jgi:hypothetical protein